MLHDVADILEFIVPGVLRQDRRGRVVEDQVGHVPAGQGGDRLLVQGLEGHDAEVDFVAAELFIVGDGFAEGRVLLLDEPLHLPDDRGGARGVGDIGTRQRRGDA